MGLARWVPLAIGAMLGGGAAVAPGAPDPPAPPPAFRILVFSKTAGYRHRSIPAGVAALKKLGTEHGFGVDDTEDATVFTTGGLRRYAAVVFLSTTGDVLDEAEQRAFEGYIRAGGGYVGIHAAADAEYDWPWYGGLLGAYFKSHPPIQPATVLVADRHHPSTVHLPQRWRRRDEWYNYRESPRGTVHVLATLDESSYEGGEMGTDHPIAWCHEYDGGRGWYTGGGHTAESFADPRFRRHLLGGIRWAAGMPGGAERLKAEEDAGGARAPGSPPPGSGVSPCPSPTSGSSPACSR